MNDMQFESEMQRQIKLDIDRQSAQIREDIRHEQQCSKLKLQQFKEMKKITRSFPQVYHDSASMISQSVTQTDYQLCLGSKPGYLQRERQFESQYDNLYPNGRGPKSPRKKRK
jgi:hypothetical protein